MNLTEKFVPDKEKPAIEVMDDILNRIMAQLDYLCKSAEFQNQVLKQLCVSVGELTKE